MAKYTEIPYSVNIERYFKLKDIIRWCNENKNYALSEKLLLYIKDKDFNNLNKEYKINRTPFLYYLEKEIEESYIRYLGYELVEKNDNIGMVQE